MDSTLASIFWSGLCLTLVSLLFTITKKIVSVSSNKLPPGWPVFGNLDLGANPHQSLASLSEKYGPCIWVQSGRVNTLVVSSGEAAKEIFKNHDISFADHTVYNDRRWTDGYWRMLQSISTTNSGTSGTRTERSHPKCIENMLKWIGDEAKENGSVEVAKFVSPVMFNVIGNCMLSKHLLDPQSRHIATAFFSISRHFIELVGKPNVSDLFPILRRLDPDYVKKKVKNNLGQLLNFASGFVEERNVNSQNRQVNARHDFLDVLLNFQGNQKDDEPTRPSRTNISIPILDLFEVCTVATTSTIEWAMTELLHEPSVMRKAQAELGQVVGQGKKVGEGDVQNLPYLQAVVKETLRLHPPAPFLKSLRITEDIKFLGYPLPKGTQILMNIWAIGREPVSWEDPLSFRPDRFLGSNTDYNGRHLEFILFGGGQQVYAGLPLAQQMLPLILGSLIHSFEWALAEGITPEKMDMRERFGTTLKKADPLKAVAKLRVY